VSPPCDLNGLEDKEFSMRVLVVGATGAIGSRLIPQLRRRGYEVTGSSRSASKAGQLRELGAEPVVLDALDGPAARRVVAEVRPDAIVYQATALAGGGFSRKLDKTFALTNRLRTEGTDNLLAAAREAGVGRFVAQSYAPYRYAHQGGPVATEDDPLTADPPASARETFAAMSHLDDAVTRAGGIALRYGGFYGDPDPMVKAVQKRTYPVVGDGAGMMSFIHLEDAAAATVLALDHDGPAVYNITDDEPAATRDWLPAMAAAVGAKPPRHFPTWLGRLFMGGGLDMMTGARGASNTKAKNEFGWTLRYPSWRQGFPASLGPPEPRPGTGRAASGLAQ
jgi:nucleoside-diphosphate-sugar epimerase